MLSVKLLLFLSFQVLAVLGLSNNVLINLPELDEEQLKWPQQKIQTIEYLLKTLNQEGNVTLIGWQQIWNDDGTLKEIRTIEMTLLTDELTDTILDPEEIDIIAELPEVLDVMDTLSSSTGILLSGSFKEWDRDGDEVKYLEVDPWTILAELPDLDLQYWQQNITVSNLEPIQNLVKILQNQSVASVGVLQWDTDGNLDLQASTIVPELLATITIAENATLPILESALTGTAKGVLLKPNEISKYVANYMKQNIPGFNWIVGEDLLASWVKPGVYLNVNYNVVDIGLDPISVDILGITI